MPIFRGLKSYETSSNCLFLFRLNALKHYSTAMCFVAFCLFFFFSITVQAQEVRKYSNEFMNIGIGARALAMSNAQVATVNDVTSGFWNPAGMIGINHDVQFGGMHAEYFAGIAKFDYLGVAIPMENGERFLGISAIRFGVDDIPNTMELYAPDGTINYDRITSFSVADYGFLISYAQKLRTEGLNIGGNVKIIHRTAGSFATAWGFGLDFGMQYKRNNLHLGLMARDVTTTFNAWSFTFTDREKEVLAITGNEIPSNSLELTAPRLILGGAYDFAIGENFRITPELNVDITTDGKRNVPVKTNFASFDPHLGLEATYQEIIFLRAGVGNIQQATDNKGDKTTMFQPNIGIGLQIGSVGIDYAFTDIGNQSDALYSHVFSLKVGINRRPTADDSSF